MEFGSPITFSAPNIDQRINALSPPDLGNDTPLCILGEGDFFNTKFAYNSLWNQKHQNCPSSPN